MHCQSDRPAVGDLSDGADPKQPDDGIGDCPHPVHHHQLVTASPQDHLDSEVKPNPSIKEYSHPLHHHQLVTASLNITFFLLLLNIVIVTNWNFLLPLNITIDREVLIKQYSYSVHYHQLVGGPYSIIVLGR